jgi:hypothetical protein
MIHKTTAIAFLACLTLNSFAQSDSSSRRFEHYIGVQANQLFREIFSVRENASEINNPYLINYSVVSARSGMGINAGLGYIFNEFKTGDAANERETTNNNFFFRIGFETKFNVGKAWQVGVGADALIDNQKNKTISNSNTGFGKISAETNDKISALGTGPRLNINYRISQRVLVGTEASYYYRSRRIKENSKITTTAREFDPNTGTERDVTRTELSDNEDKSKNILFNVPAVIWLVLKF